MQQVLCVLCCITLARSQDALSGCLSLAELRDGAVVDLARREEHLSDADFAQVLAIFVSVRELPSACGRG